MQAEDDDCQIIYVESNNSESDICKDSSSFSDSEECEVCDIIPINSEDDSSSSMDYSFSSDNLDECQMFPFFCHSLDTHSSCSNSSSSSSFTSSSSSSSSDVDVEVVEYDEEENNDEHEIRFPNWFSGNESHDVFSTSFYSERSDVCSSSDEP